MTSGKTITSIVTSAAVVLTTAAAAQAVPVVPNFTQGSMTSHTETTSKQTETINSIDYATGWQYSVSGTNVSNNGASLLPPTTTNTVNVTPMGVTFTVLVVVGGSSDAPLLDTFVPETEYCHPVA